MLKDRRYKAAPSCKFCKGPLTESRKSCRKCKKRVKKEEPKPYIYIRDGDNY